MLPADLLGATTCFLLFEDGDNLGLRESRLFHDDLFKIKLITPILNRPKFRDTYTWTDIKQLATVKVIKQEFLIIVVNNPEHYIAKEANFLKKKGMEYNYKNYGSPLAISTNGLKCELTELITILESKLSEYKTVV